MFKFTFFLFALVAGALATPSGVAYSGPFVAAPGVVTATSSQVIARNYNGIAAAPFVAAPLTYPAPAVATYAHGPVAYASPAVRAAAPLKYTTAFL